MNTRSAFAVFATTVTLLTAGSAHASLVGDSVNGTLTNLGGSTSVSVPFTSPAVVGAGIEFTGQVLSGADPLDVGVDLSASQIAITPNAGQAWGLVVGDGFSVSLTDLDSVGLPDVVITNAQLVSTDGTGNDVWTIFNLSFGPHSFAVDFDLRTIRAIGSNTYTFELTTERVPEPATLALLALGLAGMAFRRRQIR